MFYGRERRGALIEIRYRDPRRAERMLRRWHHVEQPAARRPRHPRAGRAQRHLRRRRAPPSPLRRHAPPSSTPGCCGPTWTTHASDQQPAPIAPGIAITSGSSRPPAPVLATARATRRPRGRTGQPPPRAFLGADGGAVTTAATMLRPPGTHNFKHRPPIPVTLTRLDRHQHHAAEILAGIPELPEAEARDSRRGRRADRPPQRRPAAGDRTRRLRAGADRPARRDAARKISCPFHSDRTPSLHVYPRTPGRLELLRLRRRRQRSTT